MDTGNLRRSRIQERTIKNKSYGAVDEIRKKNKQREAEE